MQSEGNKKKEENNLGDNSVTQGDIPSELLKIFETVPDLYLILSPELIILTASNTYLEAIQLSRNEIIGKYLKEACLEAGDKNNSISDLLNSLHLGIKSKIPQKMSLQEKLFLGPVNKESEERYWLPSNIPVLNEAGVLQYIIHKAEEVTEQVFQARELDKFKTLRKSIGAEKELIRNEMDETESINLQGGDEKTRNLVKLLLNAPDPYLILDPGYNIRLASEAYLEATYSRRRDIIGKYVFDAFPDNPQNTGSNAVTNLKKSLDKVLVTKKPDRMAIQRYDVPRPKEDGDGFVEKFWSPINIPVLSEKGKVDYIIHRVMDVTEAVKKQGEIKDLSRQTEILSDALNAIKEKARELEESRNLLNEMFNASPYSLCVFKAIYTKDSDIEDFEILICNEFTEKITGINGSHNFGKRYSTIFPQIIESGVLDEFKRVEKNGKPSNFERLYQGEGMKHWFYYRISKVNDLLLVITEDITERKQAEEELVRIKDEQTRLATDRYQSLFSSMDEGFCILEMIFNEEENPVDYRYIDINPVFEKQTGMKDALGKTIKELVPDIESFWIEIYGKVAVTGESVRFEDHAVSMGRWFDVNAFRIGNPLDRHVAVLFNDITERKNREEEIKSNQNRHAFLLKFTDEIRDLIDPLEIQTSSCNLLGEFLKANRIVYCENHGNEFVIQYDYVNGLPSMVGRYPVEAFGPEKFLESFRKGEAYVVRNAAEDPTLTESEKSAYVAVKMYSFIGVGLINKGKLLASFGVHSSIPRNWTAHEIELTQTVAERTWTAVERAKAEEALKESEMRFRTMAEASGILIAQADASGNAIYFNNEWLKITGRRMEDLLQIGWTDLFHPDDRDEFVKAYIKSVERKEVLKREFRLLSVSGEYRWLLAVVTPRFSVNGNYSGQISSCIDITDLKVAEQELEQKNEELVKINNDLDNFIYTASHDLKAPISNIEGLMNALVKNLPEEVKSKPMIQKVSSMIELSIGRFKNTILDLTEISRLQKQFGENVSMINLQELIEEIKLDLETDIEKNNAEIHIDVTQCSEIQFSEKNLRSVVYNLISNAIKYRAPERAPKIFITCEKENKYYVITVKDNGLGIAPSQHEKIFTMFKRVHNHVEGSGVGLYIVKKIVENAGGRIELESEVDKGSTFRVYLKE